MSNTEQQMFLDMWDWEAKKTVELLKSLPANQYDFRPDPKGRSIGEMAWHLAEGDAYMTFGIENNGFQTGKPPGIERPKTIAELAPGYERVHRDAVARVQKLTPADWDKQIAFFDNSPIAVRHILWYALLHHTVHHRAQLALMTRLAGGTVPGIYGPNREDTEKMREAMKAKAGAP